MTIFQLLRADHEKVLRHLAKLDQTSEASPRLRERLFAQFLLDMLTHAKSEEAAVYAVLTANGETRDLALDAIEAHALADQLISQLDVLDKAEEAWTAKMTVLKELIEHHMEEEECGMFRKMRKSLSDRDLIEMAREMEAQRRHWRRVLGAGRAGRERLAA